MTIDRLLRDTLHQADTYEPSPDLFRRVQRSVEEDLAHRRRVRLAVILGVAGGFAAGVYVVAFLRIVDGQLTMPWWSVELLMVLLLATVVLVLGPLIRRFGRLYAGAVFAANPPTAKRFLSLLDIAYYLVFSAYTLIVIRFVPERAWVGAGGLAAHLEEVSLRLGGLLLLMGVLHSVTIALLPLIGLVFCSGWRPRR